MNPKVKYWLEDNKDKLYMGGATLAVVAASVGGYMFFNRNQTYNTDEGVSVNLASHILSQRGDGDLELVSVEDNEAVSSMTINDEAVLFRGENLDTLYAYEDGQVFQVAVDDNTNLNYINGIAMPEMEGVLQAQTNGEAYGFLTSDELIVTDNAGDTLLVFEDRATDVFQLAEHGVYLGVDNEIHFVSFEDGETQYIDIGDETTRFSKHGDTIVARNNFGSGEDVETVLNMDDGSLLIDELKRLPYDGKVDVLVPQSENQLVYVQTRYNDDDTIARQELATMSVSTNVEADEDIDLSDFTLPMETTEAFAWYKTLASNGFVYDWTDTGLRIIEMRNGREASRIAMHSEEPQLFVPIYLND